jgi:hypothetical protein
MTRNSAGQDCDTIDRALAQVTGNALEHHAIGERPVSSLQLPRVVTFDDGGAIRGHGELDDHDRVRLDAETEPRFWGRRRRVDARRYRGAHDVTLPALNIETTARDAPLTKR